CFYHEATVKCDMTNRREDLLLKVINERKDFQEKSVEKCYYRSCENPVKILTDLEEGLSH
ncbi:MAG: hypothetical protein Q7U04_16995, partial [Bacteriovorax sp.]|nr:hypothetical protein [Bacteriovorax sp.]